MKNLVCFNQPAADYKPSGLDQSVREQELEMKIKENEILHEQLQEANQQHTIIVRKLEGRLEVLEREAGGHNKTIDETNARYNRIIERLQEDRAASEVMLISVLFYDISMICNYKLKLVLRLRN